MNLVTFSLKTVIPAEPVPVVAFGGSFENASAGFGGSFAPDIKLTVRKDFPETFIWEKLEVNSSQTSG